MIRLLTLTFSIFLLVSCAPQESPTPPTDSEQYVRHTVRYSGETLGGIASWYTGSSSNWPAIANANPGLQVKNIRIGDTIKIPQQLVRRTDPMPTEFVAPKKMVTQNTQPVPEAAKMAAAQAEQVGTETSPIDTPPQAGGPDTQLYEGVMFSDVAQVKSALQAGADANHKETNRPMLSWAAQNGNVEIVKALLDAKAEIEMKDAVGHTALMRATDMDKVDALKTLIEAKADLNAKAPNGETAIMLGVKGRYVNVVRTLVEAGADLNAADEEGNTPILTATQDGNLEIISLLGAGKANLNVSNIIYTPLSYAIEQGNKELVEALLKAGADPNATSKSGAIPLILAIGNSEILALLLHAKADPNITNGSGDTVLMVAVERDASDSIESLIKAGANPNTKSSSGSTALTQAQNMAKNEIAELLKKNGATE